jgi:hypothetical protein
MTVPTLTEYELKLFTEYFEALAEEVKGDILNTVSVSEEDAVTAHRLLLALNKVQGLIKGKMIQDPSLEQ